MIKPNDFIRNGGFGLTPQGPTPNELQNTWDTIVAEDTLQAEIVLREAYEMEYDIARHGVRFDPPRPLWGLSLHPKEDVKEGTLFELWVNHFTTSGIKDHYGLNLLEFFELPIDRAYDLVRLTEKIAAKKTKDVNEALKQQGLDIPK